MGAGALGDLLLLPYFSKLWDQKYWFDTLFLVFTGHTYEQLKSVTKTVRRGFCHRLLTGIENHGKVVKR